MRINEIYFSSAMVLFRSIFEQMEWRDQTRNHMDAECDPRGFLVGREHRDNTIADGPAIAAGPLAPAPSMNNPSNTIGFRNGLMTSPGLTVFVAT